MRIGTPPSRAANTDSVFELHAAMLSILPGNRRIFVPYAHGKRTRDSHLRILNTREYLRRLG